jgi:hypothetical protein
MTEDRFPIGARFRTLVGVLRIYAYPEQSSTEFIENRSPQWDYRVVDERTGGRRGVIHEFLTDAAGVERLEDLQPPSIVLACPDGQAEEDE